MLLRLQAPHPPATRLRGPMLHMHQVNVLNLATIRSCPFGSPRVLEMPGAHARTGTLVSPAPWLSKGTQVLLLWEVAPKVQLLRPLTPRFKPPLVRLAATLSALYPSKLSPLSICPPLNGTCKNTHSQVPSVTSFLDSAMDSTSVLEALSKTSMLIHVTFCQLSAMQTKFLKPSERR